MAQNNIHVLLGYEDEQITEKYANQVNFTTNKIGGKPDLPPNITLDIPLCPLCQLPRPQVVQIYAPLDNSPYHRTLYIFACINPNCWNHSESWLCVRVQSMETIDSKHQTTAIKQGNAIEWCSEADDWDDENANVNEENGNVISEKQSDEEEESCSFEESIRVGLINLKVDDRNANNGAMSGAVGRQNSPSASAEIEGNEGEAISIDSPTIPQRNINSLLEEVAPLPQELLRKSAAIQFQPGFISVGEEYPSNNSQISDSHVRELLQEYQRNNAEDLTHKQDAGGGAMETEKYEQSNPAHGDKMFHYFLSKIKMNPGQILRYARDSPLLLHPLQDYPKQCAYCQGEMHFEMQILSTIIPKLKLSSDVKPCSRLAFGTVLVFTCGNSCWASDSTSRYEAVVLQSEI